MVIRMQDIPGPAPIKNPFQLMKLFQKINSDQIAYMDELVATYGDIVRLEIMGNTQLMTSNPQLMREILVTKASSFHKDNDYKDKQRGLARFVGDGILVSDGEFWKRQRKLVQPAFHVNRISEYANTMTQYAEEMADSWEDGTRFDMADAMMHLTLRIVAQTLFSTDVSTQTGTIDETMEAAQRLAGQYSILPAWVPTPSELSTRRAIAKMDALIYDIIQSRRASGVDTGDLLSMLIQARDDDDNGMTDKQVRDEAVTLFLAGHETTANAMNWIFMLLAQYPDVEAKLHQELDSVLGERTPTLADLRQLPYTEMVVKESMRFYPPVTGMGRQAIEPVQIGDYQVDQGASVAMLIYQMQRDPRHWENPLTFDPERFSKENEAKLDRYTYLPFGGGARVCVGVSFAMMEAQILLATIARRWQFRLEAGQVVKPEARITLYPKDGLPMTPYQRQPIMEMA